MRIQDSVFDEVCLGMHMDGGCIEKKQGGCRRNNSLFRNIHLIVTAEMYHETA